MDERTCLNCGKTFQDKYTLVTHMKSICRKRSDDVRCPICPKRFPDKATLEAHQKTQHPTCSNCGKTFSKKWNLSVHTKNNVCQKGKGDIPCPVCGKLYSDKHNMVVHLHSKHPEGTTQKSPHLSSETIDEVKCPICSTHFPDDIAMETHHKVEHPTCSNCGKTFSKKWNLSVHTKNNVCQKRKGDIPCPVCGKLYTEKRNMSVHLRSKHPKEAPKKRPHCLSDILEYKCCGQTFANGRALGRHKRNTHFQRYNDGTGNAFNDERPPPCPVYTCSSCGKDYPSPLTLRRHEMEDHGMPGPSGTVIDRIPSNCEEEEEEEEEGDPYAADVADNDGDDDDTDSLNEDPFDNPKALFRRIGEPIVDTAGQKKFRATRYRWSFRLTKKALNQCKDGFSMEVLRAVIDELFKKISKKKGLIQIKLISDYLDYPIVMPLFKIDLFSPAFFLNFVEQVLSSKDLLATDKPLTIEVIHIGEMKGGGRLNAMTISGYLQRRNGCWDPTNVGEDYRYLTLCLAASILIARYEAAKKNFMKAKFYTDPFNSVDMTLLCEEISEKAGVDMWKKCGPAELRKYQQTFNQYYKRQLIVHDWENHLNKLFVGEPQRKEQIHLLYHEEHYSLVWNFRTYIGGGKRYCEHCVKVYDKRKGHHCELECPRCLRIECPALKPENCETFIYCKECSIVFQNLPCYLAHKGSQQVCLLRRQLCTKCSRIMKIDGDVKHECRKGPKCNHCHEEVDPSEHLCVVQEPTETTRLGTNEFNVVYFDVETSTEPDGQLVPYLICCAVNCEICINLETERCEICGPRYRSWYGWQCVNEFGNWLSTTDRFEKKRTILTAHNSAKFDGYFIYKYAADRGQKPKLHFKSNDLLSMSWKKIQMKDSLQFLKCSLDKLPSILGFEGAKGFFAWRLARRCPTLEYQGEIPSPYEFGVDHMEDEKRVKFFEWYNERKNNPDFVYDLRKEALEYCMMDVKILESSWKLFRKSCLKLTDDQLDPLIGKYFTLAGFSAAIYKSLFMAHEIGIIPWGGYRNPKRVGQSLLGCAYLEYLNMQREEEGEEPLVCAANNPREARVGGYNVDGLDRRTGEVYEVLGFYWHAHCYTPDDCCWSLRNMTHPTRNPMTYADVNRETNIRLHRLQRGGRTVIQIWECEIKKLKETDPDLGLYFKRKDVARKYHKPLNPADAVYGGRVEAFKMRLTLTEEQLREGWTIEYIDFCSLYPYVQWAFEYGVQSHPEVITDREQLDALVENVDDLKDFLNDRYGLCSCKVLAPNKLRFAVLPYRARLKTLFCLCRTCAEEDVDEYCNHSDEERSFEGVYTFYELKLAMDRGYRVLCVYELWDYGEEKDKIFAEYVTKMMIMKTRHSEVPEGMTVEEYCDVWNERVPGMNIKPEDMNPNPAMRLTAKILLNSLWGKFCERGQKHFTKLLTTTQDLNNALEDETTILSMVEKVTERSLVASCKKADPYVTETGMYNPTIGAYVTAYARCTLLEKCLEVVGDRALYVDTDSLVYLSKAGLPEPPRGEALGQLTNELKAGEYGTTFQCYAPKSWRLEVDKEGRPSRVILKTKGLHLTALGSSIKTAMNQRELWDALIDMRLVEEDGTTPRDAVKEFYDYLERTVQGDIPEELIKPCLEAFIQQRWERTGRSDELAPGLIVPQTGLTRDRMTARLNDARFRRKLTRFRYDKGLLLTTNPSWPENEASTLPYGYKRDEDEDEEEEDDDDDL